MQEGPSGESIEGEVERSAGSLGESRVATPLWWVMPSARTTVTVPSKWHLSTESRVRFVVPGQPWTPLFLHSPIPFAGREAQCRTCPPDRTPRTVFLIVDSFEFTMT